MLRLHRLTKYVTWLGEEQADPHHRRQSTRQAAADPEEPDSHGRPQPQGSTGSPGECQPDEKTESNGPGLDARAHFSQRHAETLRQAARLQAEAELMRDRKEQPEDYSEAAERGAQSEVPADDEEEDPGEQDRWAIDDVLDVEKVGRKLNLLVRWQGRDAAGQPWPDSWIASHGATRDIRRKAAAMADEKYGAPQPRRTPPSKRRNPAHAPARAARGPAPEPNRRRSPRLVDTI